MTYQYFSKSICKKVEILNNEIQVGHIQFNNWKSLVEAEINSKKYIFKKKSFWKSCMIMYQSDTQEAIAEIHFDLWKSKIKIMFYSGETYSMNPTDFWHRNWMISSENFETIEFLKTKSFWNQEGKIISNFKTPQKSDLLTLIGVFIIFLKMRNAAAVAATT
ncbi:MAG: hypothetical protein V4683_13360 [Bacteroidota bacterium]